MSAPVLMIVAGVTLSAALAVSSVAAALDTSHRVAGAADAAALAAADATLGWHDDEPCQLAREVAISADAALQECAIDPRTGEARVILSGDTIFGVISARARAGPALQD